jgi:maltooligosyltrehalose trehalohydrolase
MDDQHRSNRPTIQNRRCGAVVVGGGGGGAGGAVRWRVWAPNARQVDLVLLDGDRRRMIPMAAGDRGYFDHVAPDIRDGQRYMYRLDGGPERPDPCSLWQPDGVHGASAVVRTERFDWSDRAWNGVRREDFVFYELHVGTFTPEGTFAAIIPRLPALRELGVTAVELMPVGQFPGTRNWGYDGVGLYAAQNSYGGPHGLQRLVDACHAHRLAVFLDVIYNHAGPEGNYLGDFGPYFTDRYKTPWGKAVNFDGPGSDPVRDFVLDNARMWLEEFHCDGLRLDAVHAIFDLGACHILRAIKDTASAVAARSGRLIHVIAESDLNDPRLLWPPERGGQGLDAQWNDDFHHAVHAFLTGERADYYVDFGSARDLARVLEQPFLYAGRYSASRQRKHGAVPEGLGGDRFVVCLQNHDQVGNRARGDRLLTLLRSPAQQRLASSLLLLSPYLPLIFMGEEYGEDRPFAFFCSFCDAQLVQAVREGRLREFADFAHQGEVPDPHTADTFASACLSWSWPDGSHRAGVRRLHTDLLAARQLWPALRDFANRAARLLPTEGDAAVLELVRGGRAPEPGRTVRAFFNLTAEPQSLPADVRAAAQGLLFSSEAARYGGQHNERGRDGHLGPYECCVFGPPTWEAFA